MWRPSGGGRGNVGDGGDGTRSDSAGIGEVEVWQT